MLVGADPCLVRHLVCGGGRRIALLTAAQFAHLRAGAGSVQQRPEDCERLLTCAELDANLGRQVHVPAVSVQSLRIRRLYGQELVEERIELLRRSHERFVQPKEIVVRHRCLGVCSQSRRYAPLRR